MNSKHSFLVTFLLLTFFTSCNQAENNQQENNTALTGKTETLSYASNFRITHYDGFSRLDIITPWKDAEETFSYITYPRGTKKPEGFEGAIFVETPVRSLACNSTTHVALLDFLDSAHLINGMAGTSYVYNPEVQKRIENNDIKELGLDQDLDYERLISLEPDIVLTYGINANNNIEKIKETGLTPVVVAEFMDASPLGRAEWVKFLSVFLGKEKLANTKFEEISKSYENLKAKVASQSQPAVMVGMGFEGTWYVPAGNSYVAQTIKDAGGNYLWNDKPGKITLALDFEAVYEKAKSADKWINVGQVNSKNDIIGIDERYSNFKAWNTGEIYNGNARVSPKGGYDIYESAVVNPHLVLRDLINAFHPGLLDEPSFVYYQRLN